MRCLCCLASLKFAAALTCSPLQRCTLLLRSCNVIFGRRMHVSVHVLDLATSAEIIRNTSHPAADWGMLHCRRAWRLRLQKRCCRRCVAS